MCFVADIAPHATIAANINLTAAHRREWAPRTGNANRYSAVSAKSHIRAVTGGKARVKAQHTKKKRHTSGRHRMRKARVHTVV